MAPLLHSNTGPKFAGLQSTSASGKVFKGAAGGVMLLLPRCFPREVSELGGSGKGRRDGSWARPAAQLLRALRETSLIWPKGQVLGEMGQAMAGVQVFCCPYASKIGCVCKQGRQSQELGKHIFQWKTSPMAFK